MFKVVPDQLRISDGWVRCGQCDEIFDASANMVPDAAVPAGPAPEPSAHWALAAASEPAHAPGAADAQTAPGPAPSSVPVGELSAAAAAAEPDPVSPVPSDDPAPLAKASADTPEGAGRRATDHGLPVAAAPSGEARRRTDQAPVRASFMYASATKSIWQRTWVRVALGVSCLGLLLALLAQVVYVERDRIAAMEPAFKPWLASLCAWQGCVISPIQRIDSIVIESSSFNKLRGDVYRLTFSVRSTAPIDLAVPALELTLTDSQDQVLTRRVFLGPELGARTPVLGPGAEWQGSLGVSVKGAGISDQISGYRILAFYP
ncbi:MAG: hypothetical protein RLZ81_1786 [Pseudomonadota bacterium]|jgi:predicted Zn finger-like uncharacterized protein